MGWLPRAWWWWPAEVSQAGSPGEPPARSRWAARSGERTVEGGLDVQGRAREDGQLGVGLVDE